MASRLGPHFATTELTPDAYGGAIFPLIEQFIADQIGTDETSAWAAEQRQLGEHGEYFWACIQFCFTPPRWADRRRLPRSPPAPTQMA